MDIENDDDMPEIIRIYGDPKTWKGRDNDVADPDTSLAAHFASRVDAFQNANPKGP